MPTYWLHFLAWCWAFGVLFSGTVVLIDYLESRRQMREARRLREPPIARVVRIR